MSWVARALPAKSDVDEPGVDQGHHRRRRAGVHDARAADPEQAFWPSALASRMPSATWRTSTACGFSDDTSDSMKPKLRRRSCSRHGDLDARRRR